MSLAYPLHYLPSLLHDLSIPTHPTTAPIILCDEKCYNDLCTYANDLLLGIHPTTHRRVQSWLDRSHSQMRTASSPSELFGWRRIYTDASLLKAICLVLSLDPLSAIAALDYAIIIAGAVGPNRMEVVHSLIHDIQSTNFPIPPISDLIPPPSNNTADNDILCTAESHVLELSKPPSFLSFQTDHSHYPFIIRRYANDWPALQHHPWCSAQYLKSVAGKGRIIPVEKGSDYRAEDWTQLLMSWDEFLASLDLCDQSPTKRTNDILYLAQHNLMAQFPSLRDDVIVPDYVYASLSNPNYPQYKSPQNEEQLITNVWLGPKGTVSPAHVDPYYNFYVQVHGRKTVWLAPPTVTSIMENGQLPSRNVDDGQMIGNTSLYDVFCSAKGGNNDLFWDNVPHKAMSATLGPGDLLFFPPGWWHAMRSESTSFSLSMWF